jgi:hypothetical protein
MQVASGSGVNGCAASGRHASGHRRASRLSIVILSKENEVWTCEHERRDESETVNLQGVNVPEIKFHRPKRTQQPSMLLHE